MRAAVFYGMRDVRIEDVPAPGALGPHDVEVRPVMSGVCGTDLHEYRDGATVISRTPHPLTGAALPQILGHEFAGEVERVGSDVASVRVGDRVSVMPLLACGECWACAQGWEPSCPQMACVGIHHPWGGFAERAVVAEGQVAAMPDGATWEQGAVVEPGAVAAHAVDRAGAVPGDTVLITGGGPIGTLAALYAQAAGLDVVIAEPNPQRAAFARGLDVGEVIDPSDDTAADAVRDLTGGLGVAAAIECSGVAPAFALCADAARPRATVVQTGVPGASVPTPMLAVFFKELTVVGSLCYSFRDWPRMLGLIASGRFPAERVVTARLPLDDLVTEGLEPLLDPASADVKVLVASE